MPFKEVKALRKNGNLEEALAMAQQEYDTNNADIWNKRSLAWVYYDYLKKHANTEDYLQFIEYLEKIDSISLPSEEKMVFDNCAYQLGKIVFALLKEEPVNYAKINGIFEGIKKFSFSKPSESYSFLYKAFHKGQQNWPQYLEFADWWSFENFRPEDFVQEIYNEQAQIALAEQAYNAYAKKILDRFPFDTIKANEFLPKLDWLIKNHTNLQYPPYYKAKLLLALGQKEKVLSILIPFAKKKRNDFWVWELIADVYDAEDPRHMASLCKALSLKTPESFLINIRQKLAALLIKQGEFDFAKTEITKIIDTRSENDWRIPGTISGWTAQPWYEAGTQLNDNKLLYDKYIKIAETILFEDIQEELIVVEFVNKNKKMLNFVKDQSKQGFFNYSSLIKTPKVGELFRARFAESKKEGYFKVLTLNRVTEEVKTPAIKMFSGGIRIIETANIGFVDDVFLEPKFITENELLQNQEVRGRAILSFNKKKNEWGWKAISIDQKTEKT